MRTPVASQLQVWRVLRALCVGFLFTAVSAFASDRTALLSAIHTLENPRDLTRVGKHGELGAYQFRPATWRMHTAIPFTQALNRATSDSVAVKHYEWIKRGLEAARVPATNYNIALAWNGGLSAAISGKAPRAAHSYAQRAVNLTSTYQPARMVAEPITPPTPKVPQFFADAR